MEDSGYFVAGRGSAQTGLDMWNSSSIMQGGLPGENAAAEEELALSPQWRTSKTRFALRARLWKTPHVMLVVAAQKISAAVKGVSSSGNILHHGYRRRNENLTK
ncbi:MAG: hypothetical protein R3C40_07895 [Parvularculaceae bacterium]